MLDGLVRDFFLPPPRDFFKSETDIIYGSEFFIVPACRSWLNMYKFSLKSISINLSGESFVNIFHAHVHTWQPGFYEPYDGKLLLLDRFSYHSRLYAFTYFMCSTFIFSCSGDLFMRPYSKYKSPWSLTRQILEFRFFPSLNIFVFLSLWTWRFLTVACECPWF